MMQFQEEERFDSLSNTPTLTIGDVSAIPQSDSSDCDDPICNDGDSKIESDSESADNYAPQEMPQRGLVEMLHNGVIVKDEVQTVMPFVSSPHSLPQISLQNLLKFREELRYGSTFPTLTEFKEMFERCVHHRYTIIRDLNLCTIAELNEMFGGGWKSHKKATIVDSAYRDLLMIFVIGETFIWSPFSETTENAVRRYVLPLTEETLREKITAIRASIAANDLQFQQRMEGLDNPVTLSDFRGFIQLRGMKALSDEQYERWTHLNMEATLSERRQREEVQRKAALQQSQHKATVVEGISDDSVSFTITTATHTKKNIPLFIVQLDGRVSGTVFTELRNKAKRFGGYYSNYLRDKAGFVFEQEEKATAFASLVEGDSKVPVTNTNGSDGKNEALQSERDTTKVAAKFRAMAERLHADSQETLSADRKTNTARRVDIANSVESTARNNIVFARTLEAIATTIEVGGFKALHGLRTKTQVELLERLLRSASFHRWQQEVQALRKEGKIINDDMRSPQKEDIRSVEYPYPTFHVDTVRAVLRAGEGKKGVQQLSTSIKKLLQQVRKNEYRLRLLDERSIERMRELLSRLPSTNFAVSSATEQFENYDRLQEMGLLSGRELHAALYEYFPLRGGGQAAPVADRYTMMERELVGVKIDGFFPTPSIVAERMVDWLDLESGMRVLDPSAGKGDLCFAVMRRATEVELENVEIQAVELQHRLCSMLKEFNIPTQQGDFLSLTAQDTGGMFDRIIMNPPFEHEQDIRHVQHAFSSFLREEGVLVAIMSSATLSRTNKRTEEFRNWLDSLHAIWEVLPEGAFLQSFRSTGVRTIMIRICKPTTPSNIPHNEINDTLEQATNTTFDHISSNDEYRFTEQSTNEAREKGGGESKTGEEGECTTTSLGASALRDEGGAATVGEGGICSAGINAKRGSGYTEDHAADG